MPLIPLPWQDPSVRIGQERKTLMSWLGSRLRNAQDELAKLKKHDPLGLLPGYQAVVTDMLNLKSEMEANGLKYTMPEHLQPHYDDNFAPKESTNAVA